MHPITNIAIRAARSASKIILHSIDKLDSLEIKHKSRHDFVTQVDKAAEQEIIETIRKSYPDHAILGEESGLSGENDHLWIIDPLDGTTNYIHGLPQFAISIAHQYKGQIENGVIYDPIRQDLFVANRGKGARLNDKRIRVSNRFKLENALLGTGFPYTQPEQLCQYLEAFKEIFPQIAGIRRCGAATLDLAYVAAGFLDGFWEMNLSSWDIAAGILMIKEAGGLVSDFKGGEDYLSTGNVVAGNPKIFKIILKIIRNKLTSDQG
jgi:myo-inositol-1(or 4)-monophosphatase